MAKLKIENIKQELILQGWLLFSTKYDNLDTLLEMQCPEGHRNFMSLRAWRKKQKCPTCDKNKFKNAQDISAQSKDKKAKRVLALDASTSITGWAVFDNETLIGYGKISATKKQTIEKIAVINEWLVSMIDQWSPDIVVIEDIQQQINPKTFKILAKLQGVLENTVFSNGIDVLLTASSSWRSGIGVRGSSRQELKNNAQKKVREWYDISVSEDEADAICLGKDLIINKIKNGFYNWEV